MRRFAVSVLALVLFIAACGGDEAALETYLQGVSTALSDTQEQTSSIQTTDYPGVFENVTITSDFFSAFLPILGNFIETLNALEPPEDLVQAHDAFVEASIASFLAYQQIVEDLAQVQTADDFGAAMNRLQLATEGSSSAFLSACLDLERAGQEKGVTVDVACEGR